MRPIKMVDLVGQYTRIKPDIDQAIQRVLDGAEFIQGPAVREFETALSAYFDGAHVISCGNGTDALQIAMMALHVKPGAEIILPVHTYVATAEVIALLRLVPVFADVQEETFNLDPTQLESLISEKTVAIVPVHLYGQCADMEPILEVARKHQLHVIEDAAQSIGADYKLKDGSTRKGGTLGTIGTTSFFPSKGLGAMGDGGAMMTRDKALAEELRMIANHGQRKKYQHDVIGINSRLDTLQASILLAKLNHLEDFIAKRRAVAIYYDAHLKDIPFLKIPVRAANSTHVFHQYTIRVENGKRNALKAYLQDHGIPTMIYYPTPLHLQPAYRQKSSAEGTFPVTERLSQSVLSLPVHTEMDEEQLSYICTTISHFDSP